MEKRNTNKIFTASKTTKWVFKPIERSDSICSRTRWSRHNWLTEFPRLVHLKLL
jgi:hypothetical protein